MHGTNSIVLTADAGWHMPSHLVGTQVLVSGLRFCYRMAVAESSIDVIPLPVFLSGLVMGVA